MRTKNFAEELETPAYSEDDCKKMLRETVRFLEEKESKLKSEQSLEKK